jgi:hypothetical protein
LLGVCSEFEQRISAPPVISTQLNRLVDIAVTARHRCGKWHLEALAIPDSAFEAADFRTRLRMVKYLQDLRLLLWLLCRKEYSRDGLLDPSCLPRSELILEARLVSSWSLSTLFGIPTRVPLAKFRYEHEYHEMDLQRILAEETTYKIFTSELLQAKTNIILFVTTTAAALRVAEKWLDTLLKYLRHMENLDTRLQLTRLEILLGPICKSLQDMLVLIEALMQAPFANALANKRKARGYPRVQEILHDWERELARLAEKLQEFESIYIFS